MRAEDVSATLNFLDGGGEMGALMRMHDWRNSPLKSPEQWPDALRSSISLCLNLRFPIILFWGPEYAILYNDAWRPMLDASRHPQALGRPAAEAWPEGWDVLGPQLRSAFAGTAASAENQRLIVNRSGYREDAYFTYSCTPVRNAGGGVEGVFTALCETTQQILGKRRLRALQALAEKTAERLSLATEAAGLGVFEWDAENDQPIWGNDRMYEIFGRPRELGPITASEFFSKMLVAEDAAPFQKEAKREKRSGATFQLTGRIRAQGMSQRWIQLHGRYYEDEAGKLFVTGVVADISEQKKAAERQQTLINELNHRVKNTLSMIQAIASQTSRATSDPGVFQQALTGRINSLALVHEALTKASWSRTSLAEVISLALAAATTSIGERVDIAGPPIEVDAGAAVTLSMVFHELATNALKYGALSSPGGRLELRWRVAPSSSVKLSWAEVGGPPVLLPSRIGFGSRMINLGVTGQLEGRLRVEYPPSGLVCEMEIPLSTHVRQA